MLHLLLSPLLAPCALASPQTVQGSVLHHPAPLVYFEMKDVQSVFAEYKSTAYAKILADPEIRKAMEKVFDLGEGGMDDPKARIHEGLNSITGGTWDELRPSLSDLAAISFSYHLKGISPADLAGLKDDEDELDFDAVFESLEKHSRLFLEVRFRDAKFAEKTFDFCSAYVDSEGLEDLHKSEFELFDGQARQVVLPQAMGSDMPAGMVQAGTQLFFVLGEEPESYLHGRVADENKVTSAERFQEGHKVFGEGTGRPVYEFKSELAQAFYPLCPSKEYILPIAQAVASALGPDFDMLLRGGQWRVQMEDGPDGTMFVTEAFQKDLELGPFDRLFFNKSIQLDALDYMSHDAVLGAAMTMDSEVLAELVKHVFEDVGEDPFAEWETTYNFRPEDDLLQHLGSTWVSSLPLSGIGFTKLPGIANWIDLSDREGFVKGLHKLQEVIEGESDGEATLQHREFRRYELFILKVRGLKEEVPLTLEPTIAVFKDRILLTASRSQARTEIRRIEALDTERTPHPYLSKEKFDGPKGVTEAAYLDWAAVLGRVYSGAKSILPMVLGDPKAMGLPINLGELPEPELFTKYFVATTRWREPVEGGSRIFCRSSLGPESSGLITVAMTASTLMVAPWFMVGQAEPIMTGPTPVTEPK